MNSIATRLAAVALSVALVGCAHKTTPAERMEAMLTAPPLPVAPPVKKVPLDAALAARARKTVTALLDSEQPLLRANAVEAAEQLPPGEAQPLIAARLDDDDSRVRFAAAMSAGRMRLVELRPQIERMLDMRSPNGRVAALFALHQFGDASRTILLQDYAVDESDVVRANTAVVLGLIGEPTAVRVLRVMREDPDNNVRLNAADALWRLRDKEGFEALLAASISQFSDDQTIATLALANPRDPRAVPALEGKLTGDYPEVALAAARGLGLLGVDRGYDLAAKYAGSDDPRRRAMAALAFGGIGRLDAQPKLAPLLADADPRVRVAAADAVLGLAKAADAEDVFTSATPQ